MKTACPSCLHLVAQRFAELLADRKKHPTDLVQKNGFLDGVSACWQILRDLGLEEETHGP